MKLYIISFLLILQLANCKREVKINKTLESSIVNNEKSINSTLEDFDEFFNKFSNDSLFQVSRVKFPIKVVELNVEQLIEETIELDENTYYFQNISKNSKDYTIEKKINPNKCTVFLRGSKNGIYMEIFFEKKNGFWFLKTWNNFST